MVWATCCCIFFLILTPAYGKAQDKSTKRLVIRESRTINNYNPNYKQSKNKTRTDNTLSITTEKDSSFEEDNYKHRPRNKSVDRVIIKEVVDKKDENYKHQFPLGNKSAIFTNSKLVS
jgi:hypothetical protein